MPTYDKKTIADLIDGILPWKQLKGMMSAFKDPQRFHTYIEVLQERVAWKDRILLPYGLHLYIVQKENGDRIVKCDCGHEFGDYEQNWKLSSLIYVRDSEEKINELYPKYMGADPKWMVLREYFCPGCLTQLEVEAVPPGYPIIFDFQPDIESFYEKWLGRPV